MKTISVRELQKALRQWLETSQRDAVVVTRHGKPVAVIRGVEGLEWDTIMLEADPGFWKMVEARRGEATLSLDEVKRRVRDGSE